MNPNSKLPEHQKPKLQYNCETGKFTWLHNKKYWLIGKDAGCVNRSGYVVIRFGPKLYLGHRLAWYYHYGTEPIGIIDHIDGDKTNNKISNLRPSTYSLNSQNLKGPKKNNSTGFLGVSFEHGRFVANIKYNNRKKFLGYYDTPEEAYEVYLKNKRIYHEGNTL